MSDQTTAAPKVILLHPEDNILVVVVPIKDGEEIVIDNLSVVVNQNIGVGHKIARDDLSEGQKVFRYGAPIGSMIEAAKKGQHVHMHNMKSDYIPSHTRTQQKAFKGESV